MEKPNSKQENQVVSIRMKKKKKATIVLLWGSVQNWINILMEDVD